MTTETYIKQSLELNLFFLRIMKEHALFMALSFPPVNEDLTREAKQFNTALNNLLVNAVDLSVGVIDISNDAVTPYTLDAEIKTFNLTGFPIDTKVTEKEMNFSHIVSSRQKNISLLNNVHLLNERAISTVDSLIQYKTKVLNGVLACKFYTTNFPLLIEHIRREAILFVESLRRLQDRIDPINLIEEALKQEGFWDRIMAEHSQFISGLLDPSESKLKEMADDFAVRFYELENRAKQTFTSKQQLSELTKDSIDLTKQIHDFKVQGTEGILNCKIKSTIVPLLGDHVIRESNHYLNLLEKLNK